ncbi:hypothetical protein BASA81_004920 [Batrachochytrium salamandrivorans]|nr:hypothetical protein BASA81_004920 [Batrachochytrium salamandrivorans]
MILAQKLVGGSSGEFVVGDTRLWHRPALDGEVARQLDLNAHKLDLYVLAKQLGVLPTDIKSSLDHVVVGEFVFTASALEQAICEAATQPQQGLVPLATRFQVDVGFVQAVLSKHGVCLAKDAEMPSGKLRQRALVEAKLQQTGMCTLKEYGWLGESDWALVQLATCCITQAALDALVSELECEVNDAGFAMGIGALTQSDCRAVVELSPNDYWWVEHQGDFVIVPAGCKQVTGNTLAQALVQGHWDRLQPKSRPVAPKPAPTTKLQVEHDLVHNKWFQLQLCTSGALALMKKRYMDHANLLLLGELQQDIVRDLRVLLRFQLQLQQDEPIPVEHDLANLDGLPPDAFLTAVQQIASQTFTLPCLTSMDRRVEKKLAQGKQSDMQSQHHLRIVP